MKREFTQKDLGRISWVYTVLICIDFLNFFIGKVVGVGGMLFSIAFLGTAMIINYKTMLKIKVSAEPIVFIAVVFVYYFITRNVSFTTLFGRDFMFYFAMAVVLGMYKCDAEKLLRNLSFLSLLILVFYNDVFVEFSTTRYNDSIAMGPSYAMYPLLLAGIMHFLFYRKQAGVFQKIVYVVDAFLLFNLALKGTRGIIMSLAICVALLFASKVLDKDRSGNIHALRIVVVGILALIVVKNFYSIIEFVDKLFVEWKIDAPFLDKILALNESGDVSNGRSYIYIFIWDSIKKNPFLGHGLSTTYYNSGFKYIYPHNMFLQLWYDGGIILMVPVLMALFHLFRFIFKGKDRNEVVYCVFLTAICLPRAFVSSDIWKNAIFWLLILHSMRYYGQSRKEDLAKKKKQKEAAAKGEQNPNGGLEADQRGKEEEKNDQGI